MSLIKNPLYTFSVFLVRKYRYLIREVIVAIDFYRFSTAVRDRITAGPSS